MTNQSEQEEWRDVVGYEGLYQVSSWGRVRNKKEEVLKYRLCSQKRFCLIMLSKTNNRKHHAIHRLVAEAFIENAENKSYVDRIDHDIFNNKVSNLRWVTKSQSGASMIKHRGLSQYKGVTWYKMGLKWQAQIKQAKLYYLGRYICEHAAATAYNKAAKQLFSEYTLLNDIANCNCKECLELKS